MLMAVIVLTKKKKINFYCDLLTVSKYVFHLIQLILDCNNI